MPETTVKRLAGIVKQQITEGLDKAVNGEGSGWTPEQVAKAVEAMQKRGLPPPTLSSFVNEVVNQPKAKGLSIVQERDSRIMSRNTTPEAWDPNTAFSPPKQVAQ